MKSEKKELDALGPGMELMGGGIDASKVWAGRRCICSPGGWGYGNTSGNGCACGCFGPSPATENHGANTDKAN